MALIDDEITFVYSSANPGAVAATVSGGSTIYVLFDRASVGLDADTMAVTSSGPRARAAWSDVSALTLSSTTLTINGTAYYIKARKPHADGLEAYLELSTNSNA